MLTTLYASLTASPELEYSNAKPLEVLLPKIHERNSGYSALHVLATLNFLKMMQKRPACAATETEKTNETYI